MKYKVLIVTDNNANSSLKNFCHKASLLSKTDDINAIIQKHNETTFSEFLLKKSDEWEKPYFILFDSNLPKALGRKLIDWRNKLKFKNPGEFPLIKFFYQQDRESESKNKWGTLLNSKYDILISQSFFDDLQWIHEMLKLARVLKISAVNDGFVYKSKKMKGILKNIYSFADKRSSVLLTGETGTGKSLVAEIIHYYGNKADTPFETVNISEISHDLMASELFGHKKGSFTGADKNKKGIFHKADGGTLFIDEIGDIPMELQPKILRALGNKKIRPIGGDDVHLDLRIISATNKDLNKEIESKNFRLDLYYRINVIDVRIPPLRERKEDIPILIKHFIKKNAELESNGRLKRFTTAALEKLENYNWPGNVRELENMVERSCAFSGEKIEMDVDSLPEHIKNKNSQKPVTLRAEPGSNKVFNPKFNQEEEKLMKQLIDKHNCNMSQIRDALKKCGYTKNTSRGFLKNLVGITLTKDSAVPELVEYWNSKCNKK